MQKWEYMTIGAKYANESWRPFRINGQDMPNWENGKTIFEYLAALGDQGWEMISETYHQGYPVKWSMSWYSTSYYQSSILKKQPSEAEYYAKQNEDLAKFVDEGWEPCGVTARAYTTTGTGGTSGFVYLFRKPSQYSEASYRFTLKRPKP